MLSKIQTIQTLTQEYDKWEFKNQMYAMSKIAKSLKLRMFFCTSTLTGRADSLSTTYVFKTTNGRNLAVITLWNTSQGVES